MVSKSQQSKAKTMIHDIYLAECKEDAERTLQKFVSKYELKYSKAVDCLTEK